MGGMGAGVIMGGMGLIGSSMAASAQESAASTAANAQLEMFNKTVALQAPWTAAGTEAIGQLEYNMGLNPQYTAPTYAQTPEYGKAVNEKTKLADIAAGDTFGTGAHSMQEITGYKQGKELTKGSGIAPPPGGWTGPNGPPTMDNYKQQPGYLFQVAQGTGVANQAAAASGLLLSGQQQQALTNYGQQMGANDYQTFLNQYYQSLSPAQSLAGLGQTAATSAGNAATTTGQGLANSAYYAGNARASGYLTGTAQAQNMVNNMNNSGSFSNLWNIINGNSGGSSVSDSSYYSDYYM